MKPILLGFVAQLISGAGIAQAPEGPHLLKPLSPARVSGIEFQYVDDSVRVQDHFGLVGTE